MIVIPSFDVHHYGIRGVTYSSYDVAEPITKIASVTWEDEGFEGNRPAEVTIQLLRDGILYDSATLSSENNWRYTWEELDASYEWRVIQRNEPTNYIHVTSQNGITWNIKYTYDPSQPTDGSIPVAE